MANSALLASVFSSCGFEEVEKALEMELAIFPKNDDMPDDYFCLSFIIFFGAGIAHFIAYILGAPEDL